MFQIYRPFPEDPDAFKPAITLPPSAVKKNKGGWKVEAYVHEDYIRWINYFEADHPKYGFVWGDFESYVYASSQEAYEDFIRHWSVERWDYWDI